MVHLMSAGRIRYLRPGEKGPKTPAFRLRFADGGELVLTEGGPKKRAGVWLLRPDALAAELAHLGPEADEVDRRAAGRDPPLRLAPPPRRPARPAAARRHRPRVGERDPARGEALAVRADHAARRLGGRPPRRRRSTRSSPAASSCASAAPRTRRPTASTTASASRATSAAPRSPASTSSSTRSSTAPPARPTAASSRTAACRGCCAEPLWKKRHTSVTLAWLPAMAPSGTSEPAGSSRAARP